jgi:hypothetical protein
MMGKPFQSLAADVLRLNRTQIRVVTGLMTGHCGLRKHLHTMGIFKENPVWRLCNEEETISHIVFECEVLALWRFNLLGITNLGEEIPMKNLVNRLLDLIKGTNLFAQEWMNMEKHNKPNGCSVRDEKGRLLHHCITIYSPLSSPSKDVYTIRLRSLLPSQTVG